MGAMASFVINAHASRPCPCTKPIWAPPSPSQGGTGDMRIYLVVIDESPEASVALRFAARRAVKTGGAVEILALLPPPEFVQWGGVQATIEEEARLKAEGLVAAAAGTLVEESGLKPSITVRQGEARKVIREIIAQTHDKIGRAHVCTTVT